MGNFNPLPSCEGRHELDKIAAKRDIFQSTPLMRGETNTIAKKEGIFAPFQSTPLIRGETA